MSAITSPTCTRDGFTFTGPRRKFRPPPTRSSRISCSGAPGWPTNEMNEQDRGLELKVGIFVAVGLAILAALVVQFGRLGEGFKTYYGLTVHFSDASGLLKGSDVLLGGAKVGRVAGPP